MCLSLIERRHDKLFDVYDKLNELITEVEKLGYKEVDEGLWHHSGRPLRMD